MRVALDMYDDMPKYMRKYLQNYGWHFNKALCSYATSLMNKNGKKLEPLTKEYVDKVLENNNIKLTKNSHTIHHFAKSWKDPETTAERFFRRHPFFDRFIVNTNKILVLIFGNKWKTLAKKIREFLDLSPTN